MDGDIGTIIDEIEHRFMRGVPIGVVTAVTNEASRPATLEAIRERRMTGELYEPRDDHLQVT